MLERWQLSHSFLCQNILTVIHNCTFTDPVLGGHQIFCLPILPPHHGRLKYESRSSDFKLCWRSKIRHLALDTIAVSTFTLGQGEGAHIAFCSSYSSHVNTRMSPSQVRIFSHGHQFDVHHCDSNVQRWNCGSQYQLNQLKLQMQHSCKNSRWCSSAGPQFGLTRQKSLVTDDADADVSVVCRTNDGDGFIQHIGTFCCYLWYMMEWPIALL